MTKVGFNCNSSHFAHNSSLYWTSCPPWLTAELWLTSPPRDQSAAPGGGAWAKPAPPNIPSRGPLQLLSIKVSEQRRSTIPVCGRLGRICRNQPQRLFWEPLVWELPFQLLWFLSFSYLIIFLILTIRPHCFALLIFLLLSPTVCCSPAPAERRISHHFTTSHHCPFLCCCSGFWRALLDYNAGGFIFVLISICRPVHSGHHHFFSLRDVLQRVEVGALNRGEYPRTVRWMNYCRAPLVSWSRSLIWRCSNTSDRGLWSVRIPTGSGYKVKKLPRSALSGALALWFIFCGHIWLFWEGLCTHPEAHRLTMGDSMWRYYFGILFIAFKVDLCRAIILESIYWNTTNTK